MALYSLGRVEEALAGWTARVSRNPEALAHAEDLYWYTLTLLAARRPGEAAAVAERAREAGLLDGQGPWVDELLDLLVLAHMESGDVSTAAERAGSLVQRRGGNMAVRFLHSLAQARQTLGEEAGDVWAMMASVAPEAPEAVNAKPPTVSWAAKPTAAICLHGGTWNRVAMAAARLEWARNQGWRAWLVSHPSPRGTVYTVLAHDSLGAASPGWPDDWVQVECPGARGESP